MQRRKFLNGSVAVASISLAGCLGDDDDEEPDCLPEDEQEFFEMNEDQIRAWAPSGSGYDLRIPRQVSRPDADVRDERDEDERTHWLDLTYSDDSDNAYLLQAQLFRTEEYASDDASTAQPGSIVSPDPQEGLIDSNTVITGSRGRFSYRVLAEDGLEDEAQELFLMMPCVEEEHIQDTTW